MKWTFEDVFGTALISIPLVFIFGPGAAMMLLFLFWIGSNAPQSRGDDDGGPHGRP